MLDMRDFANTLLGQMAAAQTGAPIMDHDHHELHDDSDAAELGLARQESTLSALYGAAMLGLPEDDLRHLCGECGVTYPDLQAWTPPVLRVANQPNGGDATDQLPF